jgi:hypothetical protein
MLFSDEALERRLERCAERGFAVDRAHCDSVVDQPV